MIQLLTGEAAAAWCRARGLVVGGLLPSNRLSFGLEPRLGFRTPLTESAISLMSLAYVLLMSLVPDDDERRFPGGMLWLQEWDIWSETTERVGHLIARSLRGEEGSIESLQDRPAQLFGVSQITEAHAAFAIPLLFQWDAHFVPTTGTYCCFTSHDGHLDVYARDAEMLDCLVTRFEVGGLATLSLPR
mgnify:CR=1 FL=1